MAKLVCQSGPSAGHEYPLNKDLISMGRQSTCDVQILDTMSSRVHCQVRKDGKLFTLVDLGSRNGTHLNGKKVTERQLAFGDKIRVGEAEYLMVKEPGDVELKDLLSKYEIQEKLGEGGMGIVYKANQRSMARAIALKILSPKYASKPRFVEQFIREARAAGALNHPNIIQVHDVGTENGIHFFSMEFVDGPTCMQVLRENGPFPVPEALEIIRQTAKALEYAHGQRLIHQDIKPDNIMLSSNNAVKLADLGISKTFDEVESEEGPKRVMGTPHYMAPEAALGKKIDHRVDLYSLGATLYHLLTGKTPYAGTSATEVLKAHVMDPLPAIQDINPGVPENVCALVERLMAKKAEDRYQTAGEVAEEIKRLQTGLNLGTDRIASSETMILQRLARGAGSGNAGIPTPSETTGSRPARSGSLSTSASTTGGRSRGLEKNEDEGGGSSKLNLVLFFGLAVVIAFLAVLIVPRLGLGGPPAPGTGPSANPGTPKPPTPPTNPSPTPVDNGEQQKLIQQQSARLAALENQVRTQGDSADLDELLKGLDDPTWKDLDPSLRPRAAQLNDRIQQMVQRKRAALKDKALSDLQTEVRKLSDEKNFDLALTRIDAFPDKADAAVAPRLTALHDDVAKTRDNYLADLKQKTSILKAGKSIPRLKELREQLPAPLIGSPAEQDIVKAIAEIEAENQAKFQAIIKDTAIELVHWNLSKVQDRHNTYRSDLGDSTFGKQLDDYRDAALKLADMTAVIAAQLKSADRAPRYRGKLNLHDDPDLIGADAHDLQLQLPAGGTISVRWQDIEPATLGEVVTLVLKDQAGQYKPALDLLATARGLVPAAPAK